MTLRTKINLLIIGLTLLATQIFAATEVSVPQLETVADTVLKFFTSRTLQIVLAIAIAGMGVGALLQKDNEQLKKGLINWMIAVGLILGASGITSIFFTTGAVIA